MIGAIEPIAVRGWQGGQKAPAPKRPPRLGPSEFVIVFDTETTIDASQTLRVGCYRVLCAGELVSEGLFHGELTCAERRLLRAYARKHKLRLQSLPQFRNWFYRYAYELRATIVGFNLPFDLSRLTIEWHPARKAFRGGWSYVLWQTKDGRENRFRPRLRIKTLNNRAALIDWTVVKRGSDDWPGRFIDLKTLTAALTDKGMSLDQAAEVFGTEHRKLGDIEHGGDLSERYLDYLRRDVLVTHELYERAMDEYAQHPIDLDPSDAYSSASIGKAYLRAFGVTPFLERSNLTDDELGFWLSAFFGGRAECRIRGETVPVTYLDVLSMYPTVFTLMKLSRFLRAGEISCEDATNDVRQLINRIDVEDLFDPASWPLLAALCEVEPNKDVLPVRMKYAGTSRSIGVNYFTSNETWWYSLADVLASKLATGRAPKIRRALRLSVSGTLPDLAPVKLRGAVEINPSSGELFKAVIEERQRIRRDLALPEAQREANQKFLKTFASSSAYGITAELNRKEGSAGLVQIHSRRSFGTPAEAIERPGRYCFPPLATLITGAARLVLAMLEHSVTDAGGSYLFMDTDSIAVVTDHGATSPSDQRLRGLSAEAVTSLVDRFCALNPYDFGGSILKIEAENYTPRSTSRSWPLYGHAVSAKRYVLFNRSDRGKPIIRKHSEHGLGTYRPPSGDELLD